MWQKTSLLTYLPLYICICAILLLHGDSLFHATVPDGDYSVLLWEIERARSFELFTGTYSRFRFHHPGPALLYYHAWLAPLLSASIGITWYGGHLLAQLLLNGFFVGMTGKVVSESADSKWCGAVSILSILWLLPNAKPGIFADIWGPSAVVCPTYCALLTAGAVAQGSHKYLWLLVGSAGLAISIHLSTAIILVPILLGAFILFCRRSSPDVARTRSLLLGSGAAVIIGLLPLIEAATTSSFGNLGRIVRFFLKGHRGHSFSEVWGFLGSLFRTPWGHETVVSYTLIGLIIGSTLLFSRQRYIRTVGVITGISLPLLFSGTMRIKGTLYPYLAWHAYSLYASIVTVFLCTILLRCRTQFSSKDKLPFYIPTLGVLLIGLCGVSIGGRFSIESGNERDFVEQYVLTLNRDPSVLYGIVPDRKQDWDLMAKVGLHATRNGISLCVPKRWGFVIGIEQTCPVVATHRSYRQFVVLKIPPKEEWREKAPHVTEEITNITRASTL